MQNSIDWNVSGEQKGLEGHTGLVVAGVGGRSPAGSQEVEGLDTDEEQNTGLYVSRQMTRMDRRKAESLERSMTMSIEDGR